MADKQFIIKLTLECRDLTETAIQVLKECEQVAFFLSDDEAAQVLHIMRVARKFISDELQKPIQAKQSPMYLKQNQKLPL